MAKKKLAEVAIETKVKLVYGSEAIQIGGIIWVDSLSATKLIDRGWAKSSSAKRATPAATPAPAASE